MESGILLNFVFYMGGDRDGGNLRNFFIKLKFLYNINFLVWYDLFLGVVERTDFVLKVFKILIIVIFIILIFFWGLMIILILFYLNFEGYVKLNFGFLIINFK